MTLNLSLINQPPPAVLNLDPVLWCFHIFAYFYSSININKHVLLAWCFSVNVAFSVFLSVSPWSLWCLWTMEGGDTGSSDMKAGMVSPVWFLCLVFLAMLQFPHYLQIFAALLGICNVVDFKPGLPHFSSCRPYCCWPSLPLVSLI